MKKMKTMLGLAAMALMMAACHQSNTFTLKGVAEGFADGDTLVIEDLNTEAELGTVIVKDGKFELTTPADSAILCNIYEKNADNPFATVSAIFFREPGTVNITLSKENDAKVSGTKLNDALQQLNEKQADISARLQETVSAAYNEDASEDDIKAAQEQFEALQQEMIDAVFATAKSNIDNELGFSIINVMGGVQFFTSEQLSELIGLMPDRFKQTAEVQQIVEVIELSKATEVGQTLPEFVITGNDEPTLNVLDLVKQNKVTVLDFWASWCGPCRGEMPFMKELLAQNADKGFGIIGISVDQDADAWAGAIEELEMTWPQGIDSDQKMSNAFHVQAIPFTVVVDSEGTILAKELRGEALQQFVEEKLAE